MKEKVKFTLPKNHRIVESVYNKEEQLLYIITYNTLKGVYNLFIANKDGFSKPKTKKDPLFKEIENLLSK